MSTKYLFTNNNNYAPIVTPSSQDTPLSVQSKKYKKYQTKIVSNIKHKELFKENYQNLEQASNLEEASKNVYNQTKLTSSQVLSNQQLLNNYQNTLNSYQSLLTETIDIIQGYSQNINPSQNPYLGKNIQFPNGTVAYVTNAGVVKPYASNVYNLTAGQNGCPSNSPIPVTIPWQNSFLTPNTVISQNPSLVAGTQMVAGQSCGNEGNNILVNSLLGSNVTPSVNYQGCYKSSSTTPVMNYLGSTASSFEECQNNAIMNNYNYFGLQNVNPSTNLGVCGMSSDLATATSLGESTYTQVTSTQLMPYTLWSSGTTTGVSATLTDCGEIQVMDANGNIIFSVPEEATDPTPSYVGEQIVFPLKPNCNPLNPNVGTVEYNGNYRIIIGDQISIWWGTGVWWWLTEVEGVSYPESVYEYLGGDSYVNLFSGGWNAITSSYPNLVANPTYAAQNGKTGVNSMGYGTVLNKGEFIGNPQGSLYLIMGTDGNLQLNTSKNEIITTNVPNCNKLFNSDYYGGGDSTNAIYNVNPVGNKSLINNVYYVSPDTELYSFPTTDTQLSSNYTTFSNYDTPNNDLLTATTSSLDQCQTACNNNSSCAGFVYDNSDNTCSLKTNGMWPYNGTSVYNTNKSIYMKNNSVINGPPGIPTNIANNVDSLTVTNYGSVKGNVVESNQEKILLQDKINVRNNINTLQQIEKTLNSLSQELANNNVTIENNLLLVLQQSNQDRKALEKIIKEYNRIENDDENSNIQNILNDSDIVVLQKNYSYILWSILAIGVIVVTFKIMKK